MAATYLTTLSNNKQQQATRIMEFLPDVIINIIISYANPRLSDEMKDCIEEAGKIQSEIYAQPHMSLKYTYKLQDGRFVSIPEYMASASNIHPPRDAKYVMNCGVRRPFLRLGDGRNSLVYDTKKKLMEMLTNYYGGNKIPLISKLKTKKHIIQRLMSL